jgi:hypothetical protein
MKQRGRKSVAALSVVSPLPGQQKPEPPEELAAEEAEEWCAIVGRLPYDWFPRETHGQLVNYCRHVVRATVIDGLIKSFRPEWAATDEGLHRLDKLTHMAERESRAIASLGTKMRITQQTRVREQTAGRKLEAHVTQKPWDKTAS